MAFTDFKSVAQVQEKYPLVTTLRRGNASPDASASCWSHLPPSFDWGGFVYLPCFRIRIWGLRKDLQDDP